MKWIDKVKIKLTQNKKYEYQFNELFQTIEKLEKANLQLTEQLNGIACKQERSQSIMDDVDAKIDALKKENIQLVERVNEVTSDQSTYNVLETKCNEIERMLESVANNQNSTVEEIKRRMVVLETDRTELFRRSDQQERKSIEPEVFNSLKDNLVNRIEIVEKDRTELYNRFDSVWSKLRACGLLNINSRLDSRIIRLEILNYYQDSLKYETLDEEQKRIIDFLRNDYDYELSSGRTYYEDEYYQVKKPETTSEDMQVYEEDGLWYAIVSGHKVFFGENAHDAKAYLEETLHWLETDTPHRYMDVAKDQIGIDQDAILVDVGAAEGYFGMKYLDQCKKVYFFECDEKWLKYLRKTCEPYGDKIEIVEGFVGDQEDHIKLDEFFRDKEKPTHIKMDIEGAEGAALRGMQELINDEQIPLTMFLCTYHRQADWDRYYSILSDKFRISASNGYYWDIQDPQPPFFRKGMMRAQKNRI